MVLLADRKYEKQALRSCRMFTLEVLQPRADDPPLDRVGLGTTACGPLLLPLLLQQRQYLGLPSLQADARVSGSSKP